MRTEVKSVKSKLADLDSSLLKLKHSGLSRLASGVREIPKSMPSPDFLSKIGMNVLERAQSVRDSLMKSMWPAKTSSKKSSLKTAVTAKAARKPAARASAKKSAVKSSVSKTKKAVPKKSAAKAKAKKK